MIVSSSLGRYCEELTENDSWSLIISLNDTPELVASWFTRLDEHARPRSCRAVSLAIDDKTSRLSNQNADVAKRLRGIGCGRCRWSYREKHRKRERAENVKYTSWTKK